MTWQSQSYQNVKWFTQLCENMGKLRDLTIFLGLWYNRLVEKGADIVYSKWGGKNQKNI